MLYLLCQHCCFVNLIILPSFLSLTEQIISGMMTTQGRVEMTCTSNTSKTSSCSTYIGRGMLWGTTRGRASLRPSFVEFAVINSPNSSFNILFDTSSSIPSKINKSFLKPLPYR
uniref:Candidate secreted effector n=1 Tax=Meloidogyne incognita TaxID=6306 RepID=A0A914M8R8_MELIC